MDSTEVVNSEEVQKSNTEVPSSDKPMTKEQEEEMKKSALHDSIKTYGTNSYYYAHTPVDFDIGKGKKFESSGIIHGDGPSLVETKDSATKVPEVAKPKTKIITKYSWLDEKKKVKIYFDLTNDFYINKNIEEENVDLNVDETSMSLTIVDPDSNTYEFKVAKLYDKIEPEKCKVVVTKDKIKVYLQKWIETKWRELTTQKK